MNMQHMTLCGKAQKSSNVVGIHVCIIAVCTMEMHEKIAIITAIQLTPLN